jgi:L-seryl-tRNA(Ser) seleniumtransferase
VARQAIAEDRVEAAGELARQRARRLLGPVINATGVLLHTNLGRAPVGVTIEPSYTNLEFDVETGRRGSRQRAVGDLLATAGGAEAAMVVNNCAGAVLLTLAALGAGRGVAVSRGEMVEIGGGFRIPDVMAQSGARLVEVGTTNRCRVADYARARDDDDLALLLKVHRSNYRIVGFTEDAEVAELAELGIPVVADIGSGLLDAACPWLGGPPPAWLEAEPAVRQTLASGADLVLFSGDKLLGGPQAGIIAGRRELVERCGRHPLARALRPGDLVLQALQELTLAYLDRRGHDIPFWRMASRTPAELERRAGAVIDQVGRRAVGTDGDRPIRSTAMDAVPGGGTLPTVTIPSHGLRIDGDVSRALRQRDRPLVGRVEQGATWLDLRTVDEDDDHEVALAVVEAIGPTDR